MDGRNNNNNDDNNWLHLTGRKGRKIAIQLIIKLDSEQKNPFKLLPNAAYFPRSLDATRTERAPKTEPGHRRRVCLSVLLHFDIYTHTHIYICVYICSTRNCHYRYFIAVNVIMITL